VSGNSSLAGGLALIFDMDGVIIDSNPVHTESWHVYLRRHGIEPGRNLPERMFGRHNSEIVRDYFGAHLNSEEVARHGATKEALYRELMRPQIEQRLVPGVRAFLARHRGAPMGVATNAERANLDFVLGESGLDSYFPARLDGDQIRNPKPDPEIYIRVAGLLCVSPANCVVFEDSVPGVQSALAAGMRVVGVSTTHQSLVGAGLHIDNFRSPELETWLSRQVATE
jgi:HAD superfamily hydrolase (TIGR01509 family)